MSRDLLSEEGKRIILAPDSIGVSTTSWSLAAHYRRIASWGKKTSFDVDLEAKSQRI